MIVFQVDPLRDSRWAELVQEHPKASIFHTVEWLKALRASYGYEPVVFTTSPPTGTLTNGLLFCRVKSWLTGRRLVSLPFSDHCEPLCDSADDAKFLIRYLQSVMERENWKYMELRPLDRNFVTCTDGLQPASKYYFHRLSLRPDLEQLFDGFDKDSIQRRIRRADRAGLVEACGRSTALLDEFYSLFVITRGRHHLPATPRGWFRNLVQCQGEALDIRVAYKNQVPIAAILTMRFKNTLYYKYGCSDARFNQFGATPWLIWRAIAAAKAQGATVFDMGRTETDNPGLLNFKNHWVGQPEDLVYLKFPGASLADSAESWKMVLAKKLFSHMPNRLLTITGRLIYRHIG